ncbi:hypothetical protein ACX0HA_04750 [Flavobacterium hauense]
MTKTLLLLLALLAFSINGFSQGGEKKEKPKGRVPSEERYKKMKALYIQQLDSETHKAADSLFQLFAYKTTPEVKLKDITTNGTDYLTWIKENLSKTEFKDFDEAKKLWDNYTLAQFRDIEANKEYDNYRKELLRSDVGVDIYIKALDDVRDEHPEKFKQLKLPKRKKKSDFYPKLPGQ